MSFPPSDILDEQFRYLKCGRALWKPESIDREIHLGDVGWLTGGGFNVLFNCTKPPDDPLNMNGVPVGFQILDFGSTNPFGPYPLITQHVLQRQSKKTCEMEASATAAPCVVNVCRFTQ